jgi:nitronate monooxygenase
MVVNAPMAGIAGGALAAAVSAAGGLGFIGGGYGNVAWIGRQLDIAGDEAVGVGLITWALAGRPRLLELVLGRGVHWIWFSFGDASPHLDIVHAAGALAVCQVQSAEDARRVVEAGADVIVAQGHESGGHGRDNEHLADLLPAVIAAVTPVPVFAAGGITTAADRRGAMAKGASGVVVGTRLYASHEALDTAAAKATLVASTATRRTTVFDLVRGPIWPAGHSGRAVVNSTVERWDGRHAALRADLHAQRRHYRQAVAADDTDVRVVWAGTGVSRIHDILPAGDIVRAIAASRESGRGALAQQSLQILHRRALGGDHAADHLPGGRVGEMLAGVAEGAEPARREPGGEVGLGHPRLEPALCVEPSSGVVSDVGAR